MDRDRIIEAYIQRMVAWEKPVNSDVLATISKQVGITPAEMHAVKRQAKAHFSRGRKYVESGYLDQAIEEMVQATSLDPLNLDILNALANVYHLRYNRGSDPADRQQALLVARRCLELKPNDQEAQVIIDFLEHTTANTQEKLSRWTRQKLAVAAGGLAILGLGVMVVSRLPMFAGPSVILGPTPGTVVPGSAIYDNQDDNQDLPAEPTTPSPAQASAFDRAADVDIPVVFEHSGLVLEARRSELGDFDNEVYYQFQGVLVNSTDQEFRQLTLKVEFLDKNGVAIATKTNRAIGASDAMVRPGDSHAFSLIQKITPELDTIRLTVSDIEQATARNTYVPPTPINYSWGSLAPENISFELASRSEEFGPAVTAALVTQPLAAPPNSPSGANPAGAVASQAAAQAKKPNPSQPQSSKESGSPTFNAEWVIINTSDYPLSELKLKADFYDANSRPLQSEEIIVIDNNDTPLLPGEVRPFRVIKSVSSGYERYKVSVLEAE
ncbi:hypothetical protein [Leptothoe sp. PORK10 BA2]|uniref:hypothetical protein n=1 Tax=Leptothoe sp. PORK10 BA2 TaxID=3110254 RepID=UPI002B202D94|nr:hypothetical protein [Leptothoe sp. PORK10 BA2]MEA5462419.1 hypothetical protein [Leptothoe sp. PORK10 BA2]